MNLKKINEQNCSARNKIGAQFYQTGKSLHRKFNPVALQFRFKKYLNPGDKNS